MKSSEEMYKSLLIRRDEYTEKRRVNRKRFTVAAVCAVVVMIAGVGVWYFGKGKVTQRNTEKTACTDNGNQNNATHTDTQLLNEIVEGDCLGVVIVNGREYCEIGWDNPDCYTKNAFLGKASDFEGNYKTHQMAYDGDVYTVNESDDYLLLFTDNDGVVVFKAVDAATVYTDRIGTIIIDGRTYRHATSFNPDDYTRTECIGRASEFEGTYRDVPEVDGDVYTVKETDDIIIIMLDNGGTVVLKYVEQG